MAILTFLSTYSFMYVVIIVVLHHLPGRFFSLLGIRASLSLYHGAIEGVLKSPVSFFDTTPMGKSNTISQPQLMNYLLSRKDILSFN